MSVQSFSDLNQKFEEKETEIQRLIEENISTWVSFRFKKGCLFFFITEGLKDILPISDHIETHTQLTENIRNYHTNKGYTFDLDGVKDYL